MRTPANCGSSWPKPIPPWRNTRSNLVAVIATSPTWSETKANRRIACIWYDLAIRTLHPHEAVKAGSKDTAQLRKDNDLDPLREREDFKKLRADLSKPK